MAVPLDVIRAFHNAFRADLAAMDAAALNAARRKGSLDPVTRRYRFFNEMLVWHARGEEKYVFPALENVAPLMPEAYERDHRGLDTLYESLDKAVQAADVLAIARATAAFNFFSTFHLSKEEAHLYRIFNEKLSVPEQGAIVAKMSGEVPQERFPEAVSWLFPLLGDDDRENMIRIWQTVLPGPAFSAATRLVKAVIGSGWTELNRRIPELK